MIEVVDAIVDGALHGVSLCVERGEVVALIGHNGSGKSTLGRLVCGAQLPQSGTVCVDGASTANVPGRALVRRLVGYVGQNPADQTVSTIVSDELAFGLWNIGCAEGEIAERVASSLDAVGLAGFEDREVPSLSGGELQRLVLASVLAMEPGYLVLDEVTSQIDSTFRSQFRGLVARLAGRGVGVVLVTHDPLEVLSCNRVLVLDAGKVIWSGAPGSLLVDYRDLWDWVLPPNDYADALRCAVADGFDLAGGFAPAHLATWLRSVRADVRSGAGSPLDAGRDSDNGRIAGHNSDACGVSGRDSDTHSVSGRKSDTQVSQNGDFSPDKGANVRISPDKGANVRIPPENVANVRISPDNGINIRIMPENASNSSIPSDGAGAFSAISGNDRVAEGEPAREASSLAFSHVSIAYENAEVLNDISLSIPSGRVTLIAGRSGAGKTTLACLAAGLTKAQSGSVLLGGTAPVPGEVALAFQNPEQQLFLETVEHELAFAPRNLGCSEDEVARRVSDAASQLEIKELLPGDPFCLSGGQARRVALASILTLSPRAVVLDEPTAGLDAPARAALHRLVQDLACKGLPVLVVSHDLEEWLAAADQVVLLADGTIAWQGTPGALASDMDAFARAGLEPPESWQLRELLAQAEKRDSAGVNGATSAKTATRDQEAGAVQGPEGVEAQEPRATAARDSKSTAAQGPKAAVARALKGVATQEPSSHGLGVAAKPSRKDAAGRGLEDVDARVKVALLLVATAALFAARAPWTLAMWAMLCLLVLRASGIGGKAVAHALKPVALLFAFIVCANLVSCDGSADVAIAGGVGISTVGAARAATAVARIIMLVCLALSVATSTTPTKLAHACTSLMRPLGHIGVPIEDVGLVLSMALRFIPVVSEEAGRIRLAQRARGVNFDEGSVLRRVRAWAAVLTPLVVGLFRRADRVAESMDARCYGQRSSGQHGRVPLQPADKLVLLGGLVVMAVLTVLSYSI
ncbi:ATP-binding cassette domain-containing protein [Enorma massiliensis]|uniref:energy-coupling factor transporter ATPase n=1 Tax=Enorma massiliensis TaxID=1472761 RepID=UPI001959FEAA|nr:energy-coupling factor transporter ATPase [Enorma massiliensis]MBM6783719.1 ATP-binding cassette domain-containing protein [Enorma massiliensis]